MILIKLANGRMEVIYFKLGTGSKAPGSLNFELLRLRYCSSCGCCDRNCETYTYFLFLYAFQASANFNVYQLQQISLMYPVVVVQIYGSIFLALMRRIK